MVCERPPRSLREISACNVSALFSPSVRGRAAEGDRGALTHHLESEKGNTPEGRGQNSDARCAPTQPHSSSDPDHGLQPWLHFFRRSAAESAPGVLITPAPWVRGPQLDCQLF